MGAQISLDLNAVIVAVTEDEPRILVVNASPDELPSGWLDSEGHRTLELSLRAQVQSLTGLSLGYVEQLYTFGDRFRHPQECIGGLRVISLAYLALVREVSPEHEARWCPWYQYFPWEDWRKGRPEVLDQIEADLAVWAEGQEALQERVAITFGFSGVPWDEYRVLERYELLYHARLVAEARRDHPGEEPASGGAAPGRGMALDHRRILATAIGRLRGKIMFRPLVFELLPETFTLLQLQRVVESLTGAKLHKQNFRRLVERGGLVEGTGVLDHHTGGRPAELFQFRREVLRERPEPGVGLPLERRS